MRTFPAGVAVVTVDLAGERAGLTLGSLLSLSLEPALVGISVSRFAALHELLRRAERFGVTLLAAGQESVAQHFARGVPPIGLWRGVPVRDEPGEAPLIDGALGWLRCTLRAEHPAGDHTFFVGEVLAVENGPASDPLVYVDGSYRSL